MRFRNPRTGIRQGRRIVVWLLAAIALLVLGAESPRAQETERPAPITLAVLNFVNRNPGDGWDWLGTGLADMLITDLNACARFQLVSRERMQMLFEELRLGELGIVDPDTAQHLGKVVKVQYVAFGSYFRQEGRIEIECHIVEVATQKLRRVEWVRGEDSAVLELQKELALNIMDNFGLPLTERERASLLRMQTSSLDAATHFYRGIDEYDNGKYVEALLHFRIAGKQDPGYLAARWRAGRMYYLLGELRHALCEYAHLVESWPEGADIDLYFETLNSMGKIYEMALNDKRAAIDCYQAIVDRASALVLRNNTKERLEAVIRKEVEATVARRQGFVSSVLLHNIGKIKGKLWSGWAIEGYKPLTPFRWKSKAEMKMAKLYRQLGQYDEAVNTYLQVYHDYEFLYRFPFEKHSANFLSDKARHLALQLINECYTNTGRVIRSPEVLTVLEKESLPFSRQCPTDGWDLDAVYRTGSWQGFELFELHNVYAFAAPEGKVFSGARVHIKGKITHSWLQVTELQNHDRTTYMHTFLGEEYPCAKEVSRDGVVIRVVFPENTCLFRVAVLQVPDEQFKWTLDVDTEQRDEVKGPSLSSRPIIDLRKESLLRLAANIENNPWHDYRLVSTVFGKSPPAMVRDGQGTVWAVWEESGDLKCAALNKASFSARSLPIPINTDHKESEPWLLDERNGYYTLFWQVEKYRIRVSLA